MKKIFTLAIMTVMCVAAMAQEQLTIQIKAPKPVTFNGQQVKDYLKLDGENTIVNMTKVGESGGQNVYHYSVELNVGTYTASLAGTNSTGSKFTTNTSSFTLTSTQTVHFWGRQTPGKTYLQVLCSAINYGGMQYYQWCSLSNPSYGKEIVSGYLVLATPDKTNKNQPKVCYNNGLLSPTADILTGKEVEAVEYDYKAYTNTIGLKKFEFDCSNFTAKWADVKKMDVSISAAGASTLCAPFNLSIPAGVKAYKLTYNNEEEVLEAEDVENTIPANTPVLLNANEDVYSFNIIGEMGEILPEKAGTTDKYYMSTVTEGALNGVYQSKYVPQNAFVLQNGEKGVGFYKVTDDKYAINAFRCYVNPSASNARSLSIVFPETTGIEEVKTESAKSVKKMVDGRLVIVKNGNTFNAAGQIIK